MLQNYQAPSSLPWQGRKDSLPGERYFQCVTCIDLGMSNLPQPSNNSFALLGFCCDAGISRNLGKPGASQGPSALRKALANLSLPDPNAFQLYDIGDVSCHGDNLEIAQQELSLLIGKILKEKHPLIVMGGGHEIAWPHYLGIRQAYPAKKLGIINIDAHFDLRPLIDKRLGSSGTPFLQIAEHCQQTHQLFSYLCLGIQPAANTASLKQKAKDLNVEVICAQTLQEKELTHYLPQVVDFIQRHDIIYLTLCLDVFASTIAPGVSAPQVFGLFPWQIRPIMHTIIQSGKVASFDIAELSPPHDVNNQTALLAANFLADYMGFYRTLR